jgi:hypothetical protein
MTGIRRAKAWAELMRKVRHALRRMPPTHEEADALMAEADEVPMSEEEIQRIVDSVTEKAG